MIDILSRQLAVHANTTAQSAINQISALSGSNRAVAPTALGSVGDGAHATADEAGFVATLAQMTASLSDLPTGSWDYTQYQNGAVIEPGVYDVGGLTLAAPSGGGYTQLQLVARVPGSVVIVIPSGEYFMTVAGRVNSVVVDGITFVGGKGAFLFTNTLNNVNLLQQFTRCLFYNYTECAISNSANDHPMLTVRDSIFMGASGSPTIGIAWGASTGGTDCAVIDHCAFQQNAYHLALGGCLTRTLVSNSHFLSFGGEATQADIWLKPNIASGMWGVNSAQGLIIEDCSWGNEGINTAAPRILIAQEDTTTGTNRATYRPSTADNSGAYLYGLTIKDGRVSAGGTMTAPFIQSNISNVGQITWRGLKFDGGPYTHIIKFLNARPSDYTDNNSNFEFHASDVIPGGAPPATLFSNYAGLGALRDYAGFWPGDANAVEVYPVSDNPNLALIVAGITPAVRIAWGGSTVAKTTDPRGGSDFHLVTAAANGVGEYMAIAGAPSAGGQMFLEMTLAQAPSRALTQVTVDVFNYATSTLAVKRIVTLPASNGRFLLPFTLPANSSPGSWQLRVYPASGVVSGTTDQFITGDWVLNSGPGRMGAKKALDRYPLLPRNQTMLGGAAGTWPTGWSTNAANGLAGLTYSVANVGSDANGDYIDLLLSGTVTHAGTLYILSEPTVAIQCPTSGAIWEHYVPMMLLSGSLPAITGSVSDGTSGTVVMGFVLYNSSVGYIAESSTAVSPGGSYALYGRSDFAPSNASLATIAPELRLDFASSYTASAKLRIYQPIIRRMV